MGFVNLSHLSLQPVSFNFDHLDLLFENDHLFVGFSDSLLCSFCDTLNIIFFLWRLAELVAFLILVVVT